MSQATIEPAAVACTCGRDTPAGPAHAPSCPKYSASSTGGWVQQWTSDGPEDLRRQFIAWKGTWLKSQTPEVIGQANGALLIALGIMRSRPGPYVFDVAGDGTKDGKCTVTLRRGRTSPAT